MSINMSSIMSKVTAYSNTKECQERMDDYIDQCIAVGRTETYSGETIITTQVMHRAAIKLVQGIIDAAASCDLPPSVMRNISSLSCTAPYDTGNGEYRVDLFFTDDLSRESLYSDMYDGVVNIIALFNNGYLAQDYVYGWWDGHKQTGDNNILRANAFDDFAYARSKLYRPALQFMQAAINDFNDKLGNLYHAVAILDDIYTETPTVGG